MAKFNVEAFVIDSYKEEIEAETEEKAQDILLEKIDNCDIEPLDGTVFFKTDEEFKTISEFMKD